MAGNAYHAPSTEGVDGARPCVNLAKSPPRSWLGIVGRGWGSVPICSGSTRPGRSTRSVGPRAKRCGRAPASGASCPGRATSASCGPRGGDVAALKMAGEIRAPGAICDVVALAAQSSWTGEIVDPRRRDAAVDLPRRRRRRRRDHERRRRAPRRDALPLRRHHARAARGGGRGVERDREAPRRDGDRARVRHRPRSSSR